MAAGSRHRRVRSALVNLSLATAVSVLLGAGLEWAARAYEARHPPPRPAEYLWDWERMWEGDFYTVGSAAAGWPPWEEFNADGLRDSAHSVEKPPRTARVVFLGDSVTLGDGLAAEQAYPQVLQAELRRAERRVELFNVALWGWSTRQQRLAYERIARRYRPDLVVLAVCLNDIPELQNNLARPPAFLLWLHERSALVRLLVNAPGREIGSVEELFERPDSARVSQAFGRFFTEVLALRRAVQADGARLAVLVFPFRFQLEAGAPQPLAQRRIASFCALERLECDDLLPVLAPLGAAAFRDYDHLSVEGAQAVASALPGRPWFPASRTPEELVGGGLSEAALLVALRDEDPARREASATLLGRRRGCAACLAPLAERLAQDADAGVRAECARSLGRSAALAAAPELSAALRDASQVVRWAAARSLAELKLAAEAGMPEMVAALASDDFYVRAFAAWRLGEWGPAARAAVPALVHSLERETREPGVALQALAKIGPAAAEAVPALVGVLRDPSARRRWNAAMALGRIGPAAATAREALVACLADDDPRVRSQAARALGRLSASDPRSVAALGATLRDPSEEVRASAARALGWLGAPAAPAVPALNGLARDEDARVRREAEKALRRIQSGLAAGPRADDEADDQAFSSRP